MSETARSLGMREERDSLPSPGDLLHVDLPAIRERPDPRADFPLPSEAVARVRVVTRAPEGHSQIP
jgi:hypothetical protein